MKSPIIPTDTLYYNLHFLNWKHHRIEAVPIRANPFFQTEPHMLYCSSPIRVIDPVLDIQLIPTLDIVGAGFQKKCHPPITDTTKATKPTGITIFST